MILRQEDKNTILEKNQENGLEQVALTGLVQQKYLKAWASEINTQGPTGIKNYLCSTDIYIYIYNI